MKKIVSTMFKCGAICASLTTAFADKDSEEANMEAVREFRWQRDGLLKELGIAANGVTPKDRREALARAMEVYGFGTPKWDAVSREVPKLHNKTLVLGALDSGNEDRFYELINGCRSCWKIAQEVFDKYSDGEIKLSSKAVKIFSECLLEITANGFTPEVRSEARYRARKLPTFLLKKNLGLFSQARMMSALDEKKQKKFCRCASKEPERAMEILDACNNGEIKIDPEPREILENWEYNFEVSPIRTAAYGKTIKGREEAAREMLISFRGKWQLKPEDARLWNMLKLVRALDTGNKDLFYQTANQIKETEPETVDEFLFVSRRMKFSKWAKKIVKDFIKQQKRSTQSPTTVSAD
ncbi:MAG: hypothetical protein ACSW8C_03725 [bacterium]